MALQTTAFASQWLNKDHVDIPTDAKETVEEVSREVFSVGSMPGLYKENQLPIEVSPSRVELVGGVSEVLRYSRCQLLLLEAGT
jgi:hypothetical protein